CIGNGCHTAQSTEDCGAARPVPAICRTNALSLPASAPRLIVRQHCSLLRSARQVPCRGLHTDPFHHRRDSMAVTSHLMACREARLVRYEDLRKVPNGEQTATYFPVPHHEVVDHTAELLKAGGWEIDKAAFALSRGDRRMFATFDLSNGIVDGITL